MVWEDGGGDHASNLIEYKPRINPRLTLLTLKCTFTSTVKGVAMPQTLSIMEARKQLTSLPETLFHNGQLDVLEITRRGKPVLAVLPWELYEAVSETLEVMGDKELMAQLRQSILDIDSGKLIAWQDAKQELDL